MNDNFYFFPYIIILTFYQNEKNNIVSNVNIMIRNK